MHDPGFGDQAGSPISATADIRLRRDQAGLLQGLVGAVLIQRLHPAGRNLDSDELFQLRHPDTAFVQVRAEGPRHIFRDVPADAALFLGHTAPVNHTSARDF